MQQDYLQPYLINKYDGFMDFESIMIAISNYCQNVEDPAIFILGSGTSNWYCRSLKQSYPLPNRNPNQ